MAINVLFSLANERVHNLRHGTLRARAPYLLALEDPQRTLALYQPQAQSLEIARRELVEGESLGRSVDVRCRAAYVLSPGGDPGATVVHKRIPTLLRPPDSDDSSDIRVLYQRCLHVGPTMLPKVLSPAHIALEDAEISRARVG